MPAQKGIRPRAVLPEFNDGLADERAAVGVALRMHREESAALRPREAHCRQRAALLAALIWCGRIGGARAAVEAAGQDVEELARGACRVDTGLTCVNGDVGPQTLGQCAVNAKHLLDLFHDRECEFLGPGRPAPIYSSRSAPCGRLTLSSSLKSMMASVVAYGGCADADKQSLQQAIAGSIQVDFAGLVGDRNGKPATIAGVANIGLLAQ